MSRMSYTALNVVHCVEGHTLRRNSLCKMSRESSHNYLGSPIMSLPPSVFSSFTHPYLCVCVCVFFHVVYLPSLPLQTLHPTPHTLNPAPHRTQAIEGGEGMPPMQPGGVRRVIIPESMGYKALAKPLAGMQFQDCQEGRGPGPIPPELTGAGEGAYQRFKNIYCNANRPYQPDVILDIKLYGKRQVNSALSQEEAEEAEEEES